MSIELTAALFVTFLLTILLFYYLYYKRCFNYWKQRGMFAPSPTFPVGNLGLSAFGFQSIFLRLETLYADLKAKNHQYAGLYFFNGPTFFPIHPEIIKHVMATDFDHFVDRGTFINEEQVPISAHLFSMKSEKWRAMRAKFSPTFTSGKMKSMFGIVVAKCEALVQLLQAKNGQVVDIKELCARTTTDIIGSAAFGLETSTLTNPGSEFALMIAKTFAASYWELAKLTVQEGIQNLGNVVKIMHDKPVIARYFTDLVDETMRYRDANKIVREDFLNTLMRMRADGISLNQIVAQAFLFFTAGFETSSSTMSYCLHELSLNLPLQAELREEIHLRLGGDCKRFEYEQVMGLGLLDRVVKETLRKYPPVTVLNRICVKPYRVPGSEVVLESGTCVVIPVWALHHDRDHFRDPEVFDPERFNEGGSIVPFTYLPFGDGPRSCIGMRFGLMQTKMGLASLISNFEFHSTDKTKRDLPINPAYTNIVFSIIGGIYLKVIKTKQS